MIRILKFLQFFFLLCSCYFCCLTVQAGGIEIGPIHIPIQNKKPIMLNYTRVPVPVIKAISADGNVIIKLIQLAPGQQNYYQINNVIDPRCLPIGMQGNTLVIHAGIIHSSYKSRFLRKSAEELPRCELSAMQNNNNLVISNETNHPSHPGRFMPKVAESAPVYRGRFMPQIAERPPTYRDRFMQKNTEPAPVMLPEVITVGVSELELIDAKDATSVLAPQLKAINLVVNDETVGQINLAGQINLIDLSASAPGLVRISGIRSNNLHINDCGGALLYLNGTVNLLQAVIEGTGQLNAQLLPVSVAFIKTRDEALATVNVDTVLNAFAYDNSNIVYLHPPLHVNEVSRRIGECFVVSASNTVKDAY